MSSVFYHALAFVFHDLFHFGAQLAPWPKGMRGVFGATLALTWIKPYIQESADNRWGKPFTKAVFYLTPLLLMGGASYYVYRSKKVALFAGGYFATVHNLIDYSRYCNAWHQVIENGKIKKDPSTYYERQAVEEFKKKKLQENLFKVKREAHFEKALCQISKGEVNQGLKLYRTQIDHYDPFRDGGEREIKLFEHTLNYYITNDQKGNAGVWIAQKNTQWKNFSEHEKDCYAKIIIEAYAKLNDLIALNEFLQKEIQAYGAGKTESAYSDRYVFTLAKGYGHFENKANEILELVTKNWNDKNNRFNQSYFDELISECVEKQ
ncbi:MAG: hypothetical protein KDK63_04170, partial [Chlamydiia bacterium]|nr:hypothetical protein [Chlamydiia bacterium]